MKLNYELLEKQREDVKEYVRQQTELAEYLNCANDPTNPEKQIGQSFTTEQFDAKLKKLNPAFSTEIHPHKIDKRCLYFSLPGGRKYVTTFENGTIPEHSIFQRKSEDVWDRNFVQRRTIGGVEVDHIEKGDLPKSEWIPGKGLVYDSPTAPGFKRVDMVGAELKRGWRTVLVYIVAQRLATPAEVENVFGVDNTAQWKNKMGKGKVSNIW